MAYDVSWVYKIVDRYSAPLAKITKKTAAFQNRMKHATTSVSKLSAQMANFRTMAASAAGIAAIMFPLNAAADFESKMIDIKRVVDFTANNTFGGFKDIVLRISQRLGKMPADIAEMAFQAGKMGIGAKEMEKFLLLVSRTSTAFDINAKKAGEMISSIKSKLGLSTAEMASMLDAVNKISDTTSATGEKSLQIIQRVFGSMKAIAMPPDLIAGWATFADIISVSPQRGAKGLEMLISRLTRFPDVMKRMTQDPSATLEGIIRKAAKIPLAERATVIYKALGERAGQFVLKAISNIGKLDETLGRIRANDFGGSMLKELNLKLKSTKTSMDRIAVAGKIASITIGEAMFPIVKSFTPIIISISKMIANFVKMHPTMTRIALAAIAITAAIAAISVMVGIAAAAFAFLLSPIGLIIAGAIIIISAFTVLYAKSEGVREAFGRIVKAFEPLTTAFQGFFELIGLVGGIADEFNALEFIVIAVMDAIAVSIRTLLSPIKLVQEAISGITGYFGDDELQAKIDQEVSSAGFGPGGFSADNAFLKNKLDGNIVVSATQGSKVEKAKFDHTPSGDLGFNMVD